MKLHRRSVLRGMVGATAVAVGLPPLEIFFNAHGTAYASGGALPRRFGLFFWGNGVVPDRWKPIGHGSDWALSSLLEPLRTVKDDITVVTGMAVKVGNTIPHWSGPAGLLSGSPLIVQSGDDYTFRAPTIDQVLAAKIGQQTRFSSLEVGVKPESGISFNGPNSRNPPESSPRRLFDRIFGEGFRAPGDTTTVDPRLGLRRSVLDAVMDDFRRLEPKLSASDKIRLDQHLAGVRQLERRIARIESSGPQLESCAVPAAPASSYPDVDGRPQLSEIGRAIADIVAFALACDQTRVFSHVLNYPVNNLLYPGMPAGHHRLTHDEAGEQPHVQSIVRLLIGELAYFIQALRSVEEGAGTLLDNCAVLATTDTSLGRTHSIEDYPLIIAGSAGGALKTGMHYASTTAENASKVMLSLVRAMGVAAPSYGVEGAYADDSLGAIES